MADCKCGYSNNTANQCDGTHKVVKKIKEDIISKIENIDLNNDKNKQLNALGMKITIIDMLRGK